jgi:hypothetical protein
MRQVTAEQFLKDVAKHEMRVELDAPEHRHVRFQEPKNSNHWFEIVTWPGSLCLRGDMGTWTFSRVTDMFTFFRNKELRINESYWAEKLQNGVHGGSGECREFSAGLFKEQVLSRLDGWDLSPEDLAEVQETLDAEVFTDESGEFGMSEHYRKLYEFDCKGVSFDCEMPEGKHYTYHFVWCLYAIVWGIQQYDAMKAADQVAA